MESINVPSRLYITAHVVEHTVQTNTVIMFPDKQAYTEAPYKKILSIELLPIMAAAPIMSIPVPKKNDAIIEIPKNFLKIMFKNV